MVCLTCRALLPLRFWRQNIRQRDVEDWKLECFVPNNGPRFVHVNIIMELHRSNFLHQVRCFVAFNAHYGSKCVLTKHPRPVLFVVPHHHFRLERRILTLAGKACNNSDRPRCNIFSPFMKSKSNRRFNALDGVPSHGADSPSSTTSGSASKFSHDLRQLHKLVAQYAVQ